MGSTKKKITKKKERKKFFLEKKKKTKTGLLHQESHDQRICLAEYGKKILRIRRFQDGKRYDSGAHKRKPILSYQKWVIGSNDVRVPNKFSASTDIDGIDVGLSPLSTLGKLMLLYYKPIKFWDKFLSYFSFSFLLFWFLTLNGFGWKK